jgi:Ca2+/Na+ antiporter
MIPLSIASIGLGLIALIRPKPTKRKRITQAAITSTITIIFAALYILFGILPRMEQRLANITEAFHWTTGIYLMLTAAILYFIIFFLTKKYPEILQNEQPPPQENTPKSKS